MTVDTSVIGKATGTWRVVLDRAVLANFAKSVCDTSRFYQRDDAVNAAGLDAVPAPPTFTFAAPYWSAFRPDDQPADPTSGHGNPMHSIMGDLFAQGALVLHGEQEFTYHRTPVAGDVLDGLQKITDIYEKETDNARMTFVVMETVWTDANSSTSEPVVTERFNLIARLKKQVIVGRLQDKVAIITGAGQGIGLAYAERFLAEGAKVVVAELVEERAADAMKALDGKGDAIFVKTDIADPDSAQQCVDEAVNAFGTVHILVNNAALYYDIDNFDTTFEYLQRVTSVNQHGAWLMTRAAAPVMAKQRYGRVINVSSGAAYAYMFPAFGDEFTGLGNYSYSITKWGIVGLTKFMAAQLGNWNITVNCIAPGVTMTEATKKIVPDMFIEGMTAMTAMKSTLQPEDLTGACVFFASDDAKFVTGQTLVIDGGLAMPA